MRRLIPIIASVASWTLIVVAALGALQWVMVIPTLHAIHDSGVEAARETFVALWALPLLSAASVGLLYLSHRTEGRWSCRIYRTLLGIALLVWSLAICDFQFRPTYGWDLFLGR
jgi:hypothetical protein